MRKEGTGPRSTDDGAAGTGVTAGQQLLPSWRRGDTSRDTAGRAANWCAERASRLFDCNIVNERAAGAAEQRRQRDSMMIVDGSGWPEPFKTSTGAIANYTVGPRATIQRERPPAITHT